MLRHGEAHAIRPLVLRTGDSLESERCGLLLRGTAVAVLEEKRLKSSVRARVAPKSDIERSLGWVTSFKGGCEWLTMACAAENSTGFFMSSNGYSPPRRTGSPPALSRGDEDYSHSIQRMKLLLGADGTSGVEAPAELRRRYHESGRRMAMAKRQASSLQVDKHVAEANGPIVIPMRVQKKGKRASAEGNADADRSKDTDEKRLLRELHRQKTLANHMDAHARLVQKLARIDGKPGTSALMSPEQLSEIAQQQMQRCAEMEAHTFDTLGSRWSEVLLSNNFSLDQFIHALDRNGDGKISKGEWRIHMRKVNPKGETRDMDAMFDSMDDNGDGDLLVQEIKNGIKRLRAEAAMVKEQNAHTKANAEILRPVVQPFLDAALSATELRDAELQLDGMWKGRPVEVRLGEMLMKRNMKIHDIIMAWDSDRSGTVDEKEFIAHIAASFDISAEKAEISDLFQRLDADHNGYLGVCHTITPFPSL